MLRGNHRDQKCLLSPQTRVVQPWGACTLVCCLYSGSALRVTQQPPFETPTASHLPGPPGAQSGSQSRPGQPSSVYRAEVGVCPPQSPRAGRAPWHGELYVSRGAGLALGEDVEETGKKGAVRSAAGEAGNPLPWREGTGARVPQVFWNLPGVPLQVGARVEAEALGSREVLSSALATVSKCPLPLGGGPWAAARALHRELAPGWLALLGWVTPAPRVQSGWPWPPLSCPVWPRGCGGRRRLRRTCCLLLPGATTVLPKPLKKLCSQVE